MRSALAIVLAAAIGAGGGTVAGCGARQQQATAEQQQFECKDRTVGYIATHHLAGSELGVTMDCAEAGPRLQRWRVAKDGSREEDARSMTPGEFDKVWREIDGSGWAFIKDCENGTLGDKDPVFVFAVKDDQQQASFKCQSQSMPYPYNTIVDPLDVAAQKGRGQLGDPEPAELKQYEHKDKQK